MRILRRPRLTPILAAVVILGCVTLGRYRAAPQLAPAHLDQPSFMVKRDQPTPPGDLLVSFVRLHMRAGRPLFVMVEIPAKLPAESQSFMHFMLSKASIHMRLRGGGVGVLNLANLAAYTVYPGVAQIPADAWIAEPAANAQQR